jgi:hypothetical protein
MAVITKGKTFASGEVVTPLKIHQLVDAATVTAIVNADIDATAAIAASKLASTLDFSSNTVTLPATSVTAAMLSNTLNLSGKTVTFASGAVVTAAIADSAVTTAKIADSAVTTAKIADRGVTAAKLDSVMTIDSKTANYTLVLGDRGKVIEVNSSSSLTVTVPTNASVAFATGATVAVTRRGTGDVTIAGSSGVTLRSDSGRLKIGKQYAAIVLLKIGTDEWMVLGNLKA